MLHALEEMGAPDLFSDGTGEIFQRTSERKIGRWLPRREKVAQFVDPILNEVGKDPDARKLARGFIFETVKYMRKEPTNRDILKAYAGALYWLRHIETSGFSKNTLIKWNNLLGEYEERTLGMP
jgi:hypothetical protein